MHRITVFGLKIAQYIIYRSFESELNQHLNEKKTEN